MAHRRTSSAHTSIPEPLTVLVATRETQGQRRSDFCNAEEGAIVHFPIECDCDRENIDGRCGCRRCMSTFGRGSTTTFKVARMNMSKAQLLEMYSDFYQKAWQGLVSDKEVQEIVEEYLEIAGAFPVGAVLEKRGSAIRQRQVVVQPS